MTLKSDSFISWANVNNFFPIITSALLVAASFYGITIKVEVLITKVDALVQTIDKQNNLIMALEGRVGTIDKRLTILETKH